MESIEILGYSASIVVLISFMVKNIKLLRFLNIIGCILFLIYSSYYGRMPLIILNSLIIVVNIYYIFFTKTKD